MRELKLICALAVLTACAGGGKVSAVIEKDQGSVDWWQMDSGVADKGSHPPDRCWRFGAQEEVC